MTQYMIGPRGKDGKPTMADFQTDKVGADVVMKRLKSKPRDEEFVREPIEQIWMDLGGSALVNELDISFEANGTKFGAIVRQLPFIRNYFEQKKESPVFVGCVRMYGYVSTCVISLETRDALLKVLRDLEIQYAHEITENERRLHDGLAGAGVLDLGQCACQSGKLYTECCGVSKDGDAFESADLPS